MVHHRLEGARQPVQFELLARGLRGALRDEFHQAVVLESAGGRHHQLVGPVAALEVPAQRPRIQHAHGLLRSEDGPPQRMPGPDPLRQQFAGLVVGIVLARGNLLAHHGLLAFHVRLGETRTAREVEQDVDHFGKVLGERTRVVADLFTPGEGIEMSSDRLEAARDRPRVPALGALEHHVLDEVRDAEPLGRFVPRAVAHPHADRNGAPVGHGLAQDGESRAQHGLEMRGRHRVASGVKRRVAGRPATRCTSMMRLGWPSADGPGHRHDPGRGRGHGHRPHRPRRARSPRARAAGPCARA